MRILLNEFSVLYRRKQFLLLSAALFVLGIGILFLYERNTEEYYYLFQEKNGTAEWYENREKAEDQYLSEYEVFLTGMEERAERIRESSFIRDERERRYLLKELQKTLEAYEKLSDIRPIKGDYTAAGKYASWSVGILFELVFLILLLYYCFYEDKDQNRYLLFRAAENGRKKLALCKLAVLFASVSVFTAVFELSEFLLLSVLYGTGDLSVPLCSLRAFRNTTLPINIGTMLVFSASIRALVLCMLLALLYALSTVFGKITLPVLILSGTAGLEFLLWSSISPTSSVRVLHYINLYSFISPAESLGSCVFLNLFGYPVSAVHITLILILLLLLIFSSAAIVIFDRVNQVRKETVFEKLMLMLRKVFHVLQEESSLFFLELYKVLIQQKKLLLLLLLLLYFGSLVRSSLLPQMFSQAEDAAYQFYAQKLQGPLGTEQEQFLMEEERRLQGLREEIGSLMEENDHENEWLIHARTQELELYEGGLERVKLQMMLLSMPDIGEGGESSGVPDTSGSNRSLRYFLNEKQYEQYLMDYRRRLPSFLIAAVGLIVLTGGFFAPDARAGMDKLIRTTIKGKRKLPSVRMGITLLFAFLLYLGITIPDFIAYFRIDGFRCFSARFSDLVSYGISTDLRIGNGFVMVSVTRLMILSGLGILSLRLSRKLRSEMISTVVLSGGAVLCTAILWILRTDLWGILLQLFGIRFR